MANRWVDGFEGYSNASIGQAYPLGANAEIVTGRGGGKAAGAGGGQFATAGPLSIPIGTAVIVGAAYNAPLNAQTISIGGEDSNNGPIAYLRIDTLGRLQVFTGFSAAPLVSVPLPMRVASVWRYPEVKAKLLTTTTFTIEVRIDKVVVLPVATFTSTASASSFIETITLALNPAFADDFYINDDTGPSPNNDYWGDTSMSILRPNGDSAVTWTPSAGATNYPNVDDAATDNDATYNQTGTATNRDTFTYEDTGLPTGTVIRTVAAMTSARRLADSGPMQVTTHIKHGGSEITGGVHSLSDTFYMMQTRAPVCPSTGTRWTPAQINAALGGYELTAG